MSARSGVVGALPRRRPGAQSPGHLAWLAALAGGAYLLKAHYAQAPVEALGWILSPTARLVGLATGSRWAFEAGVGHVSTRHATAIVAGCAGVNFLIVAVASLVIGFLDRFRTPAARARFVACALAAAYVTTLATNTLRILIDLAWRQAGLVAHAHAACHRVLGVVVYLASAWLLHALADRLTAGRVREATP